ncbi:MAG: hypothetical protein IKC22_07535 [Bacilli bacterium]|nr:hypothetical protein [Bacilli bacterium]MBR2892201.1 hypothetical protein [Bacilli bacterium]
MKKFITIVALVVTLFTISGCSNAGAKFEKELPQNIMEMIDAGWTVQEDYSIEPRKDELNSVWAKKSGIEDFHWEYSILFSKEIDGIEKYCIVSKFGSYEQAKFYDDHTKELYGNATFTFVIDEFYLTYNNGVTDYKEIFDLN